MIGITVITGFLGSGKTTLLRNLLEDSFKKKKQIAIIHNEFTDDTNNIDRIVFKDINDIYKLPKDYKNEKVEQTENEGEQNEGEQNEGEKNEGEKNEEEKNDMELKIIKEIENESGYIYELNNGCICCSNKSNLAILIEQILSSKRSYDSIFIEVAGVYDNIKVNNLLWLDELNGSKIYLNCIVHIIDSYNFLNMHDRNFGDLGYNSEEYHSDEQDESNGEKDLIYKQILVCDVLLINKIDKIEEADKERLLKFTKNMNPMASIFLTCYAKIDIEKLTNLKCYEKKNIKSLLNNLHESCFRYKQFTNCSIKLDLEIIDLIELSEKLNHMKAEFLKEKDKDRLKQIFDLKKVQIFSYKKINETLASLLWDSEFKIYRGKGIFVAFNDDIYNNKNKLKLNMYYYQSVGDAYEINLAMTDIHIFFKKIIKENKNKKSFHDCERNNCSKGCQINISEGNNGLNFQKSYEHNKKEECELSHLYNTFLENEYFSDSSSASSSSSSAADDGNYNLRNVLTSTEIFTSKFLFIGKEINENKIRIMLNSCFCDRMS